jgi:Holliday junction resolvasome RuvABC endonuclease subunit
MTNIITSGVDYSMTSPAITLHDSNTDEFTYHFYTTDKKLEWKHPFYGTLAKPFSNNQERFDRLSDWALSILCKSDKIAIEDYAFAAKGMTFTMGENTGLLKLKLWKAGLNFELVSPPSLKKFAAGKGNSNKDQMETAYFLDQGIWIRSEINQKETSENPSSDIIDSYFLCLWALQRPTSKV